MRNLFLVGFVLLLVIPSVASAADWYVRPTGANFTAGGGTSYANAWKGLENVVFGSGGVQSGTVCTCAELISWSLWSIVQTRET